MTVIYHKAVRDKVTPITTAHGKKCIYTTLPDAGFLPVLEYALIEELEEYLDTREPGELADLLEVIRRVAELRGLSWNELEEIRADRAEERGGFKENMVLETAGEEPERKMLLCTCQRGDHVFEDE